MIKKVFCFILSFALVWIFSFSFVEASGAPKEIQKPQSLCQRLIALLIKVLPSTAQPSKTTPPPENLADLLLLQPAYKNEEIGRAYAYPGQKVIYLKGEARGPYRLKFYQGLFRRFDTKGTPVETGPDDDNDPFPGWGTNGIFVLSRHYDFLVALQSITGEFYHSSLVNGEPVISAGQINIHKGKITLITDFSGHYRPTFESMMLFLQHLKTYYEASPNFQEIKIHFQHTQLTDKQKAQLIEL